MKKGTVMSQEDLYDAIRHNFGEALESGLGKDMNVAPSVQNVISSPNINTTKFTNGKSTIVVKDTEIILSGTRIAIEGKATIHLED